ncbi:MAG: DUF1156 domain-containing protein [Syntrophomonadaceae bacterium]|nr:DUF1156 domain-containing protein [Syntrophomonadaceae bacterium]
MINRNDETNENKRLIEAGFPCHQVGAETQRERGASSALPPLYYLHVWWARRPLTPSRAAILGSLLPADTDPNWFLRQLGIEKAIAEVEDVEWTLDSDQLKQAEENANGQLELIIDDKVLNALIREQTRRTNNRAIIDGLIQKKSISNQDMIMKRWLSENQPINCENIAIGDVLPIRIVAADPYWAKQRIEWENHLGIRTPEDKYGYTRAYSNVSNRLTCGEEKQFTVLDPTAGGGSIPFEALRLGHKVIANDLNPVATIIQTATLDYPARYSMDLLKDIEAWGTRLRSKMLSEMKDLFPASELTGNERRELDNHLKHCRNENVAGFYQEQLDGYLYTRQVTCPHCGGEAPLLNNCWLAKQGDKWGVRLVIDGQARGGKVSFETYRLQGSRGPNGEDPNLATVKGGVGQCIHCKQAISADEIKAQARGESPLGTWQDRLYVVVAVRFQPKLDKNGQPERYKNGERKGEIKTEKIRFFRAPNERDLAALAAAEIKLSTKWPQWEAKGLIPTESIPQGHKTLELLRVGIKRWCDMFTPRQLLGHLTLIEELNRLRPLILEELGTERGRAVVTYLQFMIDKGVDYNSKQTRWIPQRAIVSGTFGRHDFSLKWTFGEMVFTGPNSGAAWGLSQVLDAYAGIAELLQPLHQKLDGQVPPVNITCGTAARLEVEEESVDLICVDPPYYNNVQYAELSDYFYVWQRRTLADLYPDIFTRRLTNKSDEAVANPSRDGTAKQAAAQYEKLMGEIFAECYRVLKYDGIMTLMFTHKTQEAWEALTRSLIETGWIITGSLPVESEFANSQHLMNNASAASSIFISCRKRLDSGDHQPATWSGIGGRGVAPQVRQAVRDGLDEFAPLGLNPVDEMVASYGRALQVLSQHWPVLDGDELVSPLRAMSEASAVVAQYQVTRISGGRLQVADLNPEAAMALTLFGIFGLAEFPFDEALSLSKSLNISLEPKAAGYAVNGAMIGINDEAAARRNRQCDSQAAGYFAPLIRRGSKLRLVSPEERHSDRMSHPQTEWDTLQGLLMAYRAGDIAVARPYLQSQAAGREQLILDLLAIWAAEIDDDKLRQEAEELRFGLK